jgi:hypothetical protein
LSEGHGEKLIPTGEALQVVVAAETSDALLKLFVRQMLHQLREHGLAKVHASLSGLNENDSKTAIFSLNPIQIVPGSNRYKPFGNNRLQPWPDFSPDSSGYISTKQQDQVSSHWKRCGLNGDRTCG